MSCNATIAKRPRESNHEGHRNIRPRITTIEDVVEDIDTVLERELEGDDIAKLHNLVQRASPSKVNALMRKITGKIYGGEIDSYWDRENLCLAALTRGRMDAETFGSFILEMFGRGLRAVAEKDAGLSLDVEGEVPLGEITDHSFKFQVSRGEVSNTATLSTMIFTVGGEEVVGAELPTSAIIAYLVCNLGSALRAFNAAVEGQDHILKCVLDLAREVSCGMIHTRKLRNDKRCSSMGFKAPTGAGAGADKCVALMAPIYHALFITTHRQSIVVSHVPSNGGTRFMYNLIEKNLGRFISIDLESIKNISTVASVLMSLLDTESSGRGHHVSIVLAGKMANYNNPLMRGLLASWRIRTFLELTRRRVV